MDLDVDLDADADTDVAFKDPALKEITFLKKCLMSLILRRTFVLTDSFLVDSN